MYDDTVVLDTKWLIDLFKELITIKPYHEQEPKLRKCWEELEKSGKLSTYLVDHVFHKHLNCNHSPSKCDCQAKKDILALMEHFGLIAELAQHNPEKDYPYLVPSHLTSDDEEPEESLSTLAPCPLYICFSGGYIPHGLYVRLICKWCSIYGDDKPKLYRNAAKFVVDSDSKIIMRVKCCKSFIQIRLHSERKSEACFRFKAVEIKELIKDSLASLLKKCSWYSCLKYTLCVSCPLCAVKSTGAGKKEGFDGDDCLHPISDDGVLFCEDKKQWPEVQGLQYWCPRATSCSSMTESKASSGALSLTGNNKRWIVVSIALMKTLLPTLREFMASNITKHYSSLKTMKNIDTQCYGPHLFRKDGTFQLNYTSINNNKGKKEHYDYKVKSPVDLAKLYLQPHMAKFTGIDETCDLSAVLGILSSASVFTPVTQDAANEVKEHVRNKWGNCYFEEWIETEFEDCFQLMYNLVKTLNLADTKEKNVLKQLQEWEKKGVELCLGNLDADLLNQVQTELAHLLEEVQHLKETNYDEFKRVTGALQDFQEKVEQRFMEVKKRLDTLEKLNLNG